MLHSQPQHIPVVESPETCTRQHLTYTLSSNNERRHEYRPGNKTWHRVRQCRLFDGLGVTRGVKKAEGACELLSSNFHTPHSEHPPTLIISSCPPFKGGRWICTTAPPLRDRVFPPKNARSYPTDSRYFCTISAPLDVHLQQRSYKCVHPKDSHCLCTSLEPPDDRLLPLWRLFLHSRDTHWLCTTSTLPDARLRQPPNM